MRARPREICDSSRLPRMPSVSIQRLSAILKIDLLLFSAGASWIKPQVAARSGALEKLCQGSPRGHVRGLRGAASGVSEGPRQGPQMSCVRCLRGVASGATELRQVSQRGCVRGLRGAASSVSEGPCQGPQKSCVGVSKRPRQGPHRNCVWCLQGAASGALVEHAT